MVECSCCWIRLQGRSSYRFYRGHRFSNCSFQQCLKHYRCCGCFYPRFTHLFRYAYPFPKRKNFPKIYISGYIYYQRTCPSICPESIRFSLMNNSNIQIEKKEDSRLSFLQEKQGELARLVEAINRVEANEDWQKLKELFLDRVVEKLERQLKDEAKKDEVSLPKLYRLQGQIEWAKKYTNLKKISDDKRLELENFKKQIHESNPRDGAL